MDIYEKSMHVLKEIIRNQKKFNYRIYLIGGWAVWLYNPYMKSRDVDILISKDDFWKLRNCLVQAGFTETAKVLDKKGFTMMYKNDKIDIDVYNDKVGKFDAKDFFNDYKIKKINGFDTPVVSPTSLFLLKAHTALERIGTPKGEKDLSDLLAILDSNYKDINFEKISKKLDIKDIFRIILSDFKQAGKIYAISYEKYQIIKTHLKKLKML